MLCDRKNKSNQNQEIYEKPIFENADMASVIPKNVLPEHSIPSDMAYRLISDELLDEGNARLNLATFCQTYMEDEADE